MLRRFCSWLLYKHLGWKKNVSVDHPDKYIICLAPHTSNWDFAIGQLYAKAEGLKSNFLMKKEWFFWPLGSVFRAMGGIPVWRSKHTSMTDNLANEASKASVFHLCIKSRMEEGILFHCQESWNPHLALWIRLREEDDTMYQEPDSYG